MYGFLLNTFDPQVIDPSFENRLTLASSTLLRGVATVFAVLAIIWLFLVLLRVFIHDLPQRRKAKETKPTSSATQAPVATPVPAAQDDPELIAVITAAIAAYTAEEGGLPFRVVSFHRVNK